MFKYAPGMESGLGAALNMMRKHAEPDGDEGTTVTNIFNMEDKESGMNDIAGLMALMQNNKGMDLPGILALCQQKGYGREGGGWGDGMGLLVILLFFLMFNNGGWGNNGNKACAEGLVGADNCQRIIGLHDRISAAQAASTQGFFQLDTKLCSSIAEVIASVRATWATPCAIAAARLKHSLLPYCAKSVVSSVISANPPASSTPRLSLKP